MTPSTCFHLWELRLSHCAKWELKKFLLSPAWLISVEWLSILLTASNLATKMVSVYVNPVTLPIKMMVISQTKLTMSPKTLCWVLLHNSFCFLGSHWWRSITKILIKLGYLYSLAGNNLAPSRAGWPVIPLLALVHAKNHWTPWWPFLFKAWGLWTQKQVIP